MDVTLLAMLMTLLPEPSSTRYCTTALTGRLLSVHDSCELLSDATLVHAVDATVVPLME